MSTPTSRPLYQKVAVVTGATSGIGNEIAHGLARLGATTVVVGRGADRATRAAAEIASSSGNPNVEALRIDDLAVLTEVRELSAALLDRYPRIHILVNNAGAFFRRRELTPDGFERTFALNVLSPFLLTTLLVPRLLTSAPARVVNLSSAAHHQAKVDFEDLQFAGRYRGYTAYGSSKLELIWLTREFARRLSGTGVAVNAVHPGYVRTGFGLNNGGGTAFFMRIFARLFARTVEKGADTPVFVASAPELEGSTGGYYADRRLDPGTLDSRDMVRAARLFEECSRFVGVPPVGDRAAS